MKSYLDKIKKKGKSCLRGFATGLDFGGYVSENAYKLVLPSDDSLFEKYTIGGGSCFREVEDEGGDNIGMFFSGIMMGAFANVAFSFVPALALGAADGLYNSARLGKESIQEYREKSELESKVEGDQNV